MSRQKKLRFTRLDWPLQHSNNSSFSFHHHFVFFLNPLIAWFYLVFLFFMCSILFKPWLIIVKFSHLKQISSKQAFIWKKKKVASGIFIFRLFNAIKAFVIFLLLTSQKDKTEGKETLMWCYDSIIVTSASNFCFG